MHHLTSTYTLPAAPRRQLLAGSRPESGRALLASVAAGRRTVVALTAALTAVAVVVLGGAAGAGLALDAADAEAAGLRLDSRVAH
jgi:hypothetical protein